MWLLHLWEALSTASRISRTALAGYGALLRDLCVVAGPLGASRFVAVSQTHRELQSLQAVAPSGAVRDRRMRLGDGWSARSLVSLAAQSINPPLRHRSPQTAEGVRGSPGWAHGRPSGTLPFRNALSKFSLTISEGGADQALSGRDNQISPLAHGPPAAPLHEPNSAQLSQHLQLAVASYAAKNARVTRDSPQKRRLSHLSRQTPRSPYFSTRPPRRRC